MCFIHCENLNYITTNSLSIVRAVVNRQLWHPSKPGGKDCVIKGIRCKYLCQWSAVATPKKREQPKRSFIYPPVMLFHCLTTDRTSLFMSYYDLEHSRMLLWPIVGHGVNNSESGDVSVHERWEWVSVCNPVMSLYYCRYAVLGVHPGAGRKVEQIIDYEIFEDQDHNKNDRYHDIMLLKLSSPTDIKPVQLPDCSKGPKM